VSAAEGKHLVRRSSKSAPGSAETIYTSTDEVASVAAVAGRLVLVSRGARGQVFSLDVDGGARTRLGTAPSGIELDSFSAAADDTHAFAIGHHIDSLSEVAFRVPLNGGAMTELGRIKLPFDQTIKGAVVDATHVYWAISSGKVFRASKVGPAAVETVVDDADGLSAFSLAPDHIVYLSGAEHGYVVKVPKAGGARSILAQHTGARFAVAAGNGWAIYATANNELRRVGFEDKRDTLITATRVLSCGSILAQVGSEDRGEIYFANTATARVGGSVRAACVPR
jgi:hypothetical protein